ncbi:MAG TPA: dienelactone hydrolase family protein [Kofleriaceae bacterium]
MTTTREDIAGLTTRIIGPADATLTVVLMHGFGAPGDDLVALADPRWGISAPSTRFVFPAAPIELGGLYGDARAWWRLDMERLEQGIRSGEVRDFLNEIPDGLAPAREQVIAFLAALKTKFDIADGRLVIGGFSQGAMISTDVALHAGAKLAGLILMSGTLIAEKIWQPKMHTLAGLPIIQSHGKQDMLLPFAVADTLRERLIAAGAKHEWHPFTGGHEIPPPVLKAIDSFVKTRAAA